MKLTVAFTLFVMAVNGHVLGGNTWVLPNNVGSKPTDENNANGKDQPSQGSGLGIGLGGSSGNLDLLHVLGGLNLGNSMNTNNLLSNIVGNLAAQSLAGGQGGQNVGRDGELAGLLQKLVQKQGQDQIQGSSTADKNIPDEVKGMIEMTHLEKLYAALKIVGTVKETEAEFNKSMHYLCLAVRSVYRFAEMHNASVYNGTDEEMKQARPKFDSMTEEDKLKYMVNLLTTNMPRFNQAFLFLADWNCQAGYEYMQAVEAVKKMTEEAKGNN
ncbi:hypothetical protein CHS0354_042132 [Potamilus streckersoni]|uniref:Uncharacterized protein n=1 Tax=Potamilus streckersoni TaxID=2493646 RepID=A0AAE0TLD6_9BIVA|nr:hypothetical protein CHS0354_042132 [Potamilus streckersoni]